MVKEEGPLAKQLAQIVGPDSEAYRAYEEEWERLQACRAAIGSASTYPEVHEAIRQSMATLIQLENLSEAKWEQLRSSRLLHFLKVERSLGQESLEQFHTHVREVRDFIHATQGQVSKGREGRKYGAAVREAVEQNKSAIALTLKKLASHIYELRRLHELGEQRQAQYAKEAQNWTKLNKKQIKAINSLINMTAFTETIGPRGNEERRKLRSVFEKLRAHLEQYASLVARIDERFEELKAHVREQLRAEESELNAAAIAFKALNVSLEQSKRAS